MEHVYVAVAVADATVHGEWMRLLGRSQIRPVAIALEQAPPLPRAVSAVVVVLDVRHPPVPYRFWLGHLARPLVLITPHLTAAQTLCPQLPQLAAIVDPVQALRHGPQVLRMAQQVTGGTVVLPDVSAPVQRWPWHGGAR